MVCWIIHCGAYSVSGVVEEMSLPESVFNNVIGIEGKHSNNPRDNGHETMWGITIALARQYGYNGPMIELPKETARTIYDQEFWSNIKGDDMPLPLAEFVFDFAVNSGWQVANKALQNAIGALPDGHTGPKTLALIPKHTPLHIMRLMFVARAKLMAHHEDLDEFENGWFARLFDVTVRAVQEGAN